MNAESNLSFPWWETAEVLEELLQQHDLHVQGRPHRLRARPFDAPPVEVELPLLLPPPDPERDLWSYVEALPQEIGTSVIILLQAGAASCGYWDGEDLLHHKAQKRYVVRGAGKAQPTHLKTRGKSRYGSRLRLRNAARLLDETSEKLHDWWQEEGAPERVFYSCPVRTWPEFRASRPPPPFEDGPEPEKIPFDVHVPDHGELLRVRRLLSRGRVLRSPDA